MLEFSSGSWDLQHWSFQDRASEADRLSPLSSERTDWYMKRFGDALDEVERVFSPGKDGKGEMTKLVLREIQHTKLSDTVPPPRVHGLRRLQEYILSKRREHGHRWEVDNLGSLLLGMEHHYRGKFSHACPKTRREEKKKS